MIQKWKKIGRVYAGQSYCSVPIVIPISNEHLKIIFSTRDENNQSIPYSIEYDLNTNRVLSESLIDVELGGLGTFDQNGIMPTSYIIKDDVIYLYYIGWNVGGAVPFRNAIGLLVSTDGCNSFSKYSKGPLLDRSIYDNCFVASNSVIHDQDIFKMYYLSCDEWMDNNKTQVKHKYNIKYATSHDGIIWKRDGTIAIDYSCDDEYAISVPRVLKELDMYKMWYSYRGGPNNSTYRIGYAESKDGLNWDRRDNEVNLSISETGWDSEMICYPYIYMYSGKYYLFYNGNGYGKTGIGLAVLDV